MDLEIIYNEVTRKFTFGDPITGRTFRLTAPTAHGQMDAMKDLTEAMDTSEADVITWITNNLPTLGNTTRAQGIYNTLFAQNEGITLNSDLIYTVSEEGNSLIDELAEAGEAIAEALMAL